VAEVEQSDIRTPPDGLQITFDVSPTELEVMFFNETAFHFTGDYRYQLSVKNGDVWETFHCMLIGPDIGHGIPPRVTESISYSWGERIGELPVGEYKLWSTVISHDDSGKAKDFYDLEYVFTIE
jgi:hypothetical protein